MIENFLVMLFTEPAYLVEPGVGVRHSNLAGRREGVPDWLSGGQIPSEAPVPFRLMRLGGEASGLLLVVLDGSDRPRSAAWRRRRAAASPTAGGPRRARSRART